MLKTGLSITVFFIGQMLLLHWSAGGLSLPVVPGVAQFPSSLKEWTFVQEEPLDAGIAEQLGADRIINRSYQRAGFPVVANVFVAWYQWQQDGLRQPHSPQVCLPASGWTTEHADQIPLSTQAGQINVNRLSIRNEYQRGIMLYWYQTPRRAIAGDWAIKLWFVEEAVRARRTDGAFARVFLPLGMQDNAGSSSIHAAESIAQALYPALREYLPK